MKAYTDLEQSKKLAEILPLESADMIWYSIYCGMDGQYHLLSDEYNKFGAIAINREFCKTLFRLGDEHVDWLPCWSLAALLDVIPQEIFDGEYVVNITEGCDNIWVLTYDHYENRNHSYYGLSIGADNLFDACYKMIIRLHELNLL